MQGREQVFQAIRESWSAETCGTPDLWSTENPALGQCDVSSFVVWDYLGGDLVLAQVFINGQKIEHHYWNRIEGEDIDLTREQYRGNQDVRESTVIPSEYLRMNEQSMKHDVLRRLALMRSSVRKRLDSGNA